MCLPFTKQYNVGIGLRTMMLQCWELTAGLYAAFMITQRPRDQLRALHLTYEYATFYGNIFITSAYGHCVQCH